MTNISKKSKANSEHYIWGDNCSGWHLVQSDSLSVIEELMPPSTEEQCHYHNNAQQFFRILKGIATFEFADSVIEVHSGEGLHIPPQITHKICNKYDTDLEFLVISQPTTRGDRFPQ